MDYITIFMFYGKGVRLMGTKISTLIKNLNRRNITAYYFETLEDAKNEILKIIPKDSTIGIGNSKTLKEMDISVTLSKRGHIVYDKTLAKTKEAMKLMKKQALLTDWYITGTNAVSMDGYIVNIDHSGNRVAAMIYGPDNVIIVIGVNKIEDTLDDAMNRARYHAVPLNAKRAGYNPPCLELKKCVDCSPENRVCFNIVTIEGQYEPDRMQVFIVNEDLGF